MPLTNKQILLLFFVMLIVVSLACSLPGQPASTVQPRSSSVPPSSTRSSVSPSPTTTPLRINVRVGEVAKVGAIQFAVLGWDLAALDDLHPNQINGITASIVFITDDLPNLFYPGATFNPSARVEDDSGVVYPMSLGVSGVGAYDRVIFRRVIFFNDKFPPNASTKLKMVFMLDSATVIVDLGVPGIIAPFPAAFQPPPTLIQNKTTTVGDFNLTLNSVEANERTQFVIPNTDVVSVMSLDLTVESVRPSNPAIYVGYADENWTRPSASAMYSENRSKIRLITDTTNNGNTVMSPLKQRIKIEVTLQHNRTESDAKRVLLFLPAGVVGVASP